MMKILLFNGLPRPDPICSERQICLWHPNNYRHYAITAGLGPICRIHDVTDDGEAP